MKAEGNVGIAMAMVCGAGLATTLGACFVFCSKKSNQTLLSSALGASAGVPPWNCRPLARFCDPTH